MADRPVRPVPRFLRVLGSRANLTAQSVDLLFGGSDGERYSIEIDPAIVSAVLAAIMGEAKELQASLPSLVDGPTQELRATSMNVSMAKDGALAWRLSLEGDIHFDVAFSPDQFEALDRQMDDVRQMLRRRQ